MLKNTNAKKLARIVGTFIVAAVVLGLYQMSLVFSESLYFNKNSWSYLTLLANDVKNVPVFKPVDNSISYRYGIGDGITETTHSVMYQTSETMRTLNDNYKQYFESNGKFRVRDVLWPSAVFYEGKQSRYQVEIEEASNNNRLVTIDFFHKINVARTHPLKDPSE